LTFFHPHLDQPCVRQIFGDIEIMEKGEETQWSLLQGEDEECRRSTVAKTAFHSKHEPSPLRVSSRSPHLWSWLAQLLLFAISFAMFTSALRMQSATRERGAEKLSSYSPAISGLSDNYVWRRFNGTFRTPSSFKGRLTKEVQ
jgi:hypothetical protein